MQSNQSIYPSFQKFSILSLDNYTKEIILGVGAVLAAGFGIKTFVDKQKEKETPGSEQVPNMPSLKKRYSSVYAPKHLKHQEESLQQECKLFFPKLEIEFFRIDCNHRIRIDASQHAGNE